MKISGTSGEIASLIVIVLLVVAFFLRYAIGGGIVVGLFALFLLALYFGVIVLVIWVIKLIIDFIQKRRKK